MKSFFLAFTALLLCPASPASSDEAAIRARIESVKATYQSRLDALDALKKDHDPFSNEVILAYIDANGSCIQIALAYEELGEFKNALNWYSKSAKLVSECNEPLVSAKYLSRFVAHQGEARMHIMLGNYSDANYSSTLAILYAIKTDLDLGEAHLIVGQTDLILGDFKQAEESTKLALNLFQSSSRPRKERTASAYRSLAAIEFFKGKLAEAKTLWQTAASTDGQYAEIDLFDPNQVPLNAAIYSDPKNVPARMSRAEFFLDRGKQLAADKPAPNAAPLHQGGLVNVALLNSPQPSSFEESAILDLNAAIRVDNQNALAHILRAQAMTTYNARRKTTGNYPTQAIRDDITWAALYEKSEPKTLLSIANFFNENNYPPEKTLPFLSQAIYLSPPSADVVEARKLQKSLFDRRLSTAWKEAPASTPKTAMEWKERGNAYFAANDWRGALACYDRAIAIDPKFADAHANRGRVFETAGCTDWAIESFDKAITLDPKHRLAYFFRATQFANHRKFGEANQDIEKALLYAQTNDIKARVHTLRAHVGLEQLEVDKALGAARQAKILAPESPAVRQALGTALIRSYMPTEAALELTIPNSGPRARLLKSMALAMTKSDDFASDWQGSLTSSTREDLMWLIKFIETCVDARGPDEKSEVLKILVSFLNLVRVERAKKPSG